MYRPEQGTDVFSQIKRPAFPGARLAIFVAARPVWFLAPLFRRVLHLALLLLVPGYGSIQRPDHFDRLKIGFRFRSYDPWMETLPNKFRGPRITSGVHRVAVGLFLVASPYTSLYHTFNEMKSPLDEGQVNGRHVSELWQSEDNVKMEKWKSLREMYNCLKLSQAHSKGILDDYMLSSALFEQYSIRMAMLELTHHLQYKSQPLPRFLNERTLNEPPLLALSCLMHPDMTNLKLEKHQHDIANSLRLILVECHLSVAVSGAHFFDSRTEYVFRDMIRKSISILKKLPPVRNLRADGIVNDAVGFGLATLRHIQFFMIMCALSQPLFLPAGQSYHLMQVDPKPPHYGIPIMGSQTCVFGNHALEKQALSGPWKPIARALFLSCRNQRWETNHSGKNKLVDFRRAYGEVSSTKLLTLDLYPHTNERQTSDLVHGCQGAEKVNMCTMVAMLGRLQQKSSGVSEYFDYRALDISRDYLTTLVAGLESVDKETVAVDEKVAPTVAWNSICTPRVWCVREAIYHRSSFMKDREIHSSCEGNAPSTPAHQIKPIDASWHGGFIYNSTYEETDCFPYAPMAGSDLKFKIPPLISTVGIEASNFEETHSLFPH
ncbi:uncharacterized protein BDR25DRAFT_348477 [Lindgomyces ingoldianus]|uniref:Uncharacterized protein n=1 Tax=Lindgomyces ingoldianus TaxID=673940 RepID=A0ACB6RG30_9PLEO|nr:uncharacterized protein BDR25DRAFT_348477 [Lindgomyces ingoldianus]KAF2478224.1 hypothetical protein BDR25DRAFT_348477 [Lindgomyces ingoldianus]